MNDFEGVSEAEVAPSEIATLRRLCIEHDGTDPFQHTPAFHTGARSVTDARLFAVRGPDGLAGLAAVWGHEPPHGIVCVAPVHRRHGFGRSLGEAVAEDACNRGSRELCAWVAGTGPASDRFCDRWQGVLDRRLFRLRIDLPTQDAPRVPAGYVLSTFGERGDVERLVRLNAAAFATHPDQASMRVEDVHSKMREPWFDPAGLLMAWRGDDLAAYCWTKVHAEVEPAEGEIHLICTSPRHGGRGLGRAMTLAGLDHLAASAAKGILYVDETNTAARAVYRRVGFHLERIDGHYRFRFPRGDASASSPVSRHQ